MNQLPISFSFTSYPDIRVPFVARIADERRHKLAQVARTLRAWADVANRNDHGNVGTTLTIAARLVSDNNSAEAWEMLRISARTSSIVLRCMRFFRCLPRHKFESVAYGLRAYLAASRYVGTTLGHGRIVAPAPAVIPPGEWDIQEGHCGVYSRTVENPVHRLPEGSCVRFDRHEVEVYVAFPTWARDSFQWRETCKTFEQAAERAKVWAGFMDAVLGAACSVEWSAPLSCGTGETLSGGSVASADRTE